MFRRRFLKTVLACIGVVLVPKKAEAVEVPFLPTLAWLREHDCRVCQFVAEYNGCGTWMAWVCADVFDDYNWTRLFHGPDGWMVIKKTRINNDELRAHYEGRVGEWPDWLRKF